MASDARGLSHLYPAIPILNVFSMLLLLLLVPGFWKTRIVAVVSLVGWLFIGNLTSFLGMVHWRGHTNDALVWASILSALGRTWTCGFFTSIACFAHFTWQRLQPLSARQLYDTRRRDNLIHVFFTLILPVLWASLFFLSCDARYMLTEDFGPSMSVRPDWPGFLVIKLPGILSYMAAGVFYILALVRYWHIKQDDLETDLLTHHPSVRTRKLLLMAVTNTLLAGYGLYNHYIAWRNRDWTPPKSLAENISSLQSVLVMTRLDLDSTASEFVTSAKTNTAIFTPLLGFYVFVLFGCGEEARKAYGDGLLKIWRLVGVAGTLPFSWSAIALHKAKQQQGLVEPLPLIPSDALHLTPYISPRRREHGPETSAGPMIHSPNPVGNVIDRKQRASPTGPMHRLSTHKPPLAPSDPVHATPDATDPVPNLTARRLSSHKPALTPLDAANAMQNAAVDASGSISQHVADANITRRQAKFAPGSLARRLSYHKPAFVPLSAANAGGAIQDVSGGAVPLVEVPRDLISDRNNGIQAERALDGDMSPPPFSRPSTTSAPRPFSAPFATKARPPPFSIPSTSRTPPPPFSIPSISTAPPPLLAASTPSASPPLSTPVPPHVGDTSSTRRPEISTPVSRLSYHKPAFVPLGLPNASAIATPEAPGSTPPRVGDINNARRQEKFAPRARPRRLSYHKPAFVPLTAANAGVVIQDVLGAAVPLVEVPRDLIRDRNYGIQAESVLGSDMVPPPFSSLSISSAPPPFSAPFATMAPPPPFSSPSTSTAPPPPFSSPSTSTAPPPLSAASIPMASSSVSPRSTRTPAPPYQDVNSFLDHPL